MQARQCWTVLANKAEDQCDRIQQALASIQQREPAVHAGACPRAHARTAARARSSAVRNTDSKARASAAASMSGERRRRSRSVRRSSRRCPAAPASSMSQSTENSGTRDIGPADFPRRRTSLN